MYTKDAALQALKALDHGARVPFDDPMPGFNPDQAPPPARSWAHAAARGVVSYLQPHLRVDTFLPDVFDADKRIAMIDGMTDIIQMANDSVGALSPDDIQYQIQQINAKSTDEFTAYQEKRADHYEGAWRHSPVSLEETALNARVDQLLRQHHGDDIINHLSQKDYEAQAKQLRGRLIMAAINHTPKQELAKTLFEETT